MRTLLRHIIISLAVAALALHFTAVSPATDSAVKVQVQAASKPTTGYTGYTSRKVAFRKSGSLSGKVLKMIPAGTKVKVLTLNKEFVRLIYKNRSGYAAGDAIVMSNGRTASRYTSKGDKVAAFALRFLGRPYRYGGTSLTKGADCSGFIMSVYRHFGIDLPRTSRAMRNAGYRISSLKKAQPGDILCYKGHVALYLGRNMIVHASNPRNGICVRRNASYKKIITIRRIFK